MPKQKRPGKFWPWVRPMIWEKAQELYQMEQAKAMGADFKAITAERKELREGGGNEENKYGRARFVRAVVWK